MIAEFQPPHVAAANSTTFPFMSYHASSEGGNVMKPNPNYDPAKPQHHILPKTKRTER